MKQLNSGDMLTLDLYKSVYAVTGIDSKIKILTEKVGQYVKCDSVCVFEYNESGDYLKYTYGWSNEKTNMDLKAMIQISEISWTAITDDSDVFLAEDIEALPDSVRDIFLFRGVRSAVIIRCFNGEKFLGMVCLAQGGSKREWADDDIKMLRILNGMVSPLLVLKNPEKSNESYRDMALEIMNNLGSGVFVTDLETYEIMFINNSLKQMWSISSVEETLGKKCWEIFRQGQTKPCASCPIKVVKKKHGLIPGKIVKGEIINPDNGQWFYCENSFFRWSDGRLVHMECINEYYDSKRLEEGWENYASVDEQTGVYTRDWGMRILDTERIRSKNEKLPMSVCFIKIEGIKEIREVLGDISADAAINQVLDSVKNNIRATDIIFKWEADMFLILFKKCGLAYSQGIVNKINNSVEEMNHQNSFALSLNIGLQEILHDNVLTTEEIIAIAGKKMHADRFNKMKEKSIQKA